MIFNLITKKPNDIHLNIGTPEYLAPEVILNRGHDMCCDWWTLGIIIFEFLSGSPPFYDENQYKVYEKILGGHSKIEWPRHFDSAAKDIIKKLLNSDPTKRLGSGNCGIVSQYPSISASSSDLNNSFSLSKNSVQANDTSDVNGSIFLTQNESNQSMADISISSSSFGENSNSAKLSATKKKASAPSILNSFKSVKSTVGAQEIKKHRWFVSITNWSDVIEKRLKPPFKPEISHEGDTRNFEKYDMPDLYKVPYANEKQLELFVNF